MDAAALATLGAATFREAFGYLYPPDDLAAFLAETHTPAAWLSLLRDPALRTWVAEVDARLVGYALAGSCKLPHPEVTANGGELLRLYVAESQQGGGIGRRLLDEALGWLESSGRDRDLPESGIRASGRVRISCGKDSRPRVHPPQALLMVTPGVL
jgi:GNAT superfamily N-acetyltransferase